MSHDELVQSRLYPEVLVGRDGTVLVNGQPPRIYEPDRYPSFVVRRGRTSKFLRVHTLVATEFCSGYADGMEVNHINGVRSDNRAENLEWVTHRYNMHHSARTGLRKRQFSVAQVDEICGRFRAGESAKQIGASFGVGHGTIIYILRSQTYFGTEKDVVDVATHRGSKCHNATLTDRDVMRARHMHGMGMLTKDIAALIGAKEWTLYPLLRSPEKHWKHVKLQVVTQDDGVVYARRGRGRYAR